MKIVPLTEMTAVFNYDKVEKYDIKVKQWVRIKTGIYERDLAQLIFIEDSINRIYIRIIPRIGDFKKEKESIGDYWKNLKKNVKPPQKLFNATNYKDVEEKTHRNFGSEKLHYWNKMMFQAGFLIKMVKAKSLILEGVDPKLEELRIFNIEHNGNLNLDSENIFSKKKNFVKGDKVKIIKSNLANLTGTVESHSNGLVHIIPDLEDYNEMLEIPEDQIIKNFIPGDNVKV